MVYFGGQCRGFHIFLRLLSLKRRLGSIVWCCCCCCHTLAPPPPPLKMVCFNHPSIFLWCCKKRWTLLTMTIYMLKDEKIIEKIPKWTCDVICLLCSQFLCMHVSKIVHSKLIQLLFQGILGRGSFFFLVQGQINVVWMKKYSKQKKGGVSKLDSSCEHFTRNVSEKSELPFEAALKWNGFIFFFFSLSLHNYNHKIT